MSAQTSSATSTSPHLSSTGLLCGVGAGALWGLVFLAPELVREFTPVQLATGRYLAYGLMAAMLIAPRWRRLKPALTRRDWASLVCLSLTGNTLYYVLLTMAVQGAGIAVTSLIMGFLPVVVTLIGSRDQQAVPLRTLAPSLLLCAAGATCIGGQAMLHSATALHPVRGLICAVAALGSWATYTVVNSRSLARLNQVSEHDWSLLIGVVTGVLALGLLPIGLASGTLHHSTDAWARLAMISVGVAVVASFCGNALWNRMSRLLPLTMAGQMILFETLFALVYGFAWEHRLPHLLEMAAFALVMASVLTCISAHKSHAPQPA